MYQFQWMANEGYLRQMARDGQGQALPLQPCREGGHYRFCRNHSTNLGIPTSIGVVGLYPSRRLALEMSACVRGTSPGWSGNRSIRAFLPSASSSNSISLLRVTV